MYAQDNRHVRIPKQRHDDYDGCPDVRQGQGECQLQWSTTILNLDPCQQYQHITESCQNT